MYIIGTEYDAASKTIGENWTGESDLQDSTRAKELLFWKNTWRPDSGAKNIGRTIRPVYKN